MLRRIGHGVDIQQYPTSPVLDTNLSAGTAVSSSSMACWLRGYPPVLHPHLIDPQIMYSVAGTPCRDGGLAQTEFYFSAADPCACFNSTSAYLSATAPDIRGAPPKRPYCVCFGAIFNDGCSRFVVNKPRSKSHYRTQVG